MERLTERDELGNVDIICVDGADLNECLTPDELEQVTEALNRLAAYEDTGMEPEEIQGYRDLWNEMKQLQADGRLVVLPCKVGDTVYWIPGIYRNSRITACKVRGFIIDRDGNLRLDLPDIGAGPIYPWPEHIYLTCEEAEAALGKKC